MICQFYSQSSPTNKINKTLGDHLKQCPAIPQPDGPIDVVNPVLIIDGPLSSNANYCYVGEPLNRYYFITALDYTIANKVVISLHCDVLMTYRERIKDTTLNYCRGAGDINEMDDASYPISDYLIQQHYPIPNWTDIFSNQGSGRQYLLRTVCSSADTYPIVELADGQVFWSGDYFYDENDTPVYRCFQFVIRGAKQALAVYLERDDVTSMPQVLNKYYVKCNNAAWQFDMAYGDKERVPSFTYVGPTT